MKLNKIKLLSQCVSEFRERDKKAKQSKGPKTPEGAAGPAGKKVYKAVKPEGGELMGEEMVRKKQSLLKPDDQLNLTEAELREEITKTLGTGNINSPRNLVEFSYSLGEFVLKPCTGDTVVLIHLDGCCIPRDSPEAQAQIAAGGWEGEKAKRKAQIKSSSVEKDENKGGEKGEKEEEEEGEGEGEEKVEEKGEEEEPEQEAPAEGDAKPKKKLTNAFNYCERGSLTFTCSKVNASTQTIPPPRKIFSELVTQWIIYDAYAEDFEKHQKEKEKEKESKKVPGAQPSKKEEVKKKQDSQAVEAQQMRTNEGAKILDRMICQNIYDEIAQDYKYYEDPSDEFRNDEGTLLPLWKFSYEKTKKNSVTDISWNPLYYDLFAVTFGTFDFLKLQSQEGAIALFTLKNPSYPEYIRGTESGAMCVATHPTQSQLIVVGMLDGNVAVYNARLPDKTPQFQSNSVNKKHWGLVWQVKWGVDMQDGEVNFFSVSADGKVYNWILMQNELAVTTVVSLSIPMDRLVGPDGLAVGVKDCGCSISFHPLQPSVFLVGTEEGIIYKCSTAYSSIFLFKYDAHHMPVHRISHNLFYPDIFLTCSADWRIKVWEDLRSEPLFVFDLGCSVSDVQWAPYSSTVFAGVTVDGKCHVFDININKYKPICVQSVKKTGLTRLRFNLKMPILAAGDDKGNITILKLSPNLRIKPKPPKKQQSYSPEELEVMKLEKLLALVREPTTSRKPRQQADAVEPDVMDEFIRGKTLLKPDDQLDIPEAELKEEVARFLISVDMMAPKNVVEYSFREGGFVMIPAAPPTVILVHLESCSILKDSPEALAQILEGDGDGGEVATKKAKTEDGDEDEPEEETKEGEEGAEEGEEGEEMIDEGLGEEEMMILPEPEPEAAAAAAPAPGAPPKRVKKLLNAFNFCERAAMTYNNPYRDMTTQTFPPPRAVFSGLISQWMIYDFYAEDFERQQREKEKERKPAAGAKLKDSEQKKLDEMMAEILQMRTNEAANILDRMICQNVYDDISQDYRYYEDPSDEYRREEGTLLPLWKFCYEKTKKLTVTEMQWNPQYYDLFAVTFGSYDFTKPLPGALCLFSLKNPSHPEYIRLTDVGLLSVSTHKLESYLMAVGAADGNLLIYNKNLLDKTPQYQSDPVKNKHLGAIWQVRWGENLADGELNLFSISCDGSVNNWVLMQNQLLVTTVIKLTLPIEKVAGPDGAMIDIPACGSSFAFHPIQRQIYLVGTEEGKIFKCSSLYESKYLFTFEAHTMPVHKISYNRFLPSIFLSCSADWTIKIWEDMRSLPIFCFDLGCSVGDAQWAPYSSSVFAAVTVDGKCHVFDLNVNKYKAICSQNVVSRKGKNHASRLKMNYHMPILIVGDERGTITTLKLSPNLRLKAKPPKKKDVQLEPRELEILKLEKILSTVQEPNVLIPPPDKESV